MTPPKPDKPVEPKPAAAIILLRDGAEGLEVLILKKAHGQHFAAGALVFPGGRVSDEDHRLAARLDRDDDPLRAHRLAAIREMHEECGILLAHPAGQERLLDESALLERETVAGDASTLALLEDPALDPAVDRLVTFAHWITPPTRPRRFDTLFFIASAPTGQPNLRCDGFEITHAAWRRPGDIVDETAAGENKLVLPTLMNLTKLSRWSTVAEALDAARAAPLVCVIPERIETAEGIFHRIPETADYGTTMVPVDTFRLA